MKITLTLPDFTRELTVTTRSATGDKHLDGYTVTVDAKQGHGLEVYEKTYTVKGEKKKKLHYRYNKIKTSSRNGWFMPFEHPKDGQRILATLMSEKDYTNFRRAVRQVYYAEKDGYHIPQGTRIVAWREMPDAYEGGYVMRDESARLLIDAICEQMMQDYIVAEDAVALAKKKLAAEKAKEKSKQIKTRIRAYNDTIALKTSTMLDIEAGLKEYGEEGRLEKYRRMKRHGQAVGSEKVSKPVSQDSGTDTGDRNGVCGTAADG